MEIPTVETAEETAHGTPTPETPMSFRDRMPCHWLLKALEGDRIEATNHTTHETFEGTRQEFNEMLRG
jgi:hypothetical protein